MLSDAGVVTTGVLNHTVITVMPAKAVVRVAAEKELEYPGVLLCDNEECEFCREGRKRILEMQDVIRENYSKLKDAGYTDIV